VSTGLAAALARLKLAIDARTPEQEAEVGRNIERMDSEAREANRAQTPVPEPTQPDRALAFRLRQMKPHQPTRKQLAIVIADALRIAYDLPLADYQVTRIEAAIAANSLATVIEAAQGILRQHPACGDVWMLLAGKAKSLAAGVVK